jgi:hypothetical protein
VADVFLLIEFLRCSQRRENIKWILILKNRLIIFRNIVDRVADGRLVPYNIVQVTSI